MTEREIEERLLDVCRTVDISLFRAALTGSFDRIAEIAVITIPDTMDQRSILSNEHFLATYINRIKRKEISENDIAFILSFWNIKNCRMVIPDFIGTLAINNQINNTERYKELRDKYSKEGGWDYKQLHIRILINEGKIAKKDLIDEIFKYRTLWAIYELMSSFTEEEIRYLADNIQDNKYLYKSHKHELKEYIRKVKKERKIL